MTRAVCVGGSLPVVGVHELGGTPRTGVGDGSRGTIAQLASEEDGSGRGEHHALCSRMPTSATRQRTVRGDI